jgi:hypothetical protein
MTQFLNDLWRIGGLLLPATLMLVYSAPFARAVGEPVLAAWGMFAGLALYGVALSHVLRRLLFPYIDLKHYAELANESPNGAGLVFLGVSIVLSVFILLMGNVVHAAELPPNAVKYLPILQAEQRDWWPDMPMPSALGAQVEQETCVSLKSLRCWSPRAELRTSRERGVGLGQITRTNRFDALAEVRAAYPDALGVWRWDTDALYDPRFQLRGLVLKDLQAWNATSGSAAVQDRLAFVFAAYNGGIGGVLSDRQVCRGTIGCNFGRWFGHVEHTSLKAKTLATGYGKSFFGINREYVSNVLLVRRARYLAALPGGTLR